MICSLHRTWLAALGFLLIPVAVSTAAEPITVLEDSFAQSHGWVKIHAADALAAAGRGKIVRDAFATVAETPPTDGPLGYRIGVWRSMVNAADGQPEREPWMQRLRAAAIDPGVPDRLHAIETLAKLGHVPTADERAATLEYAKAASPADATLAWWLLASSGTGLEIATAKNELVKLLSDASPVAQMRAAYSLRHLAGLRHWEWVRIGENVMRGQADPLANAYLTSAAYVLSPSLDSARRYHKRALAIGATGLPAAQYEIAWALGARGSRDDVALLRSWMAGDDLDVRIAAASAILQIESRQGEPGKAPAARAVRPLTAAEGVRFEQEVAYLAPGRVETLDLYLPAAAETGTRRPAIVMIHGGAWLGGDKAGGREYTVGVTLAQAGYVYASINYQLDPSDRWPTNLHDCKNAVRFLKANADRYGIDPDRIGVIGSSAGGHLALMVAYTLNEEGLEPTAPYPAQSSSVKAVVNLFGITDIFAWMVTDEQGNPVRRKGPPYPLFSATGGGDEAACAHASPLSYVRPGNVPTLTIHGSADTTVDRDQATALHTKAVAAGTPHELILLEGVGHSFDLTHGLDKKPLARDLRPAVIEFFDRHLKETTQD